MQNGWIKFYRKTLDSRVFKNEGLLKVWIWNLLKANREKKWVTIRTGRGKKEVLVNPGQFIFGRKTAALELDMPPSSVRNKMKKLKSMRNLDIKVDSHYSVISIINWELYQSETIKEDRQEDRQRTGNGQAMDTNKNNKNQENEKKKDLNTFCSERKKKSVPSSSNKITFSFQNKKWEGITKEDFDNWQETFPACDIRIELLRMTEWLLSNPTKKKKNYRRFITNWLTRSQDKGGTKGFSGYSPPERKSETPEEKATREKQEAEESEARYQKALEKWRGMSLEELRKHQVNLRKWGKIAKIPPVEVERDLAKIIKEKEKNV